LMLTCLPSTTTSPAERYTLSLHDALPIYQRGRADARAHADRAQRLSGPEANLRVGGDGVGTEQGLSEGRADGVSLQGHLVARVRDRKSTRLNSSHVAISYAVFCLKKKI